jgi:hypothetical protein
LRNYHIAFHNGCINLHSHYSVQEFPFLHILLQNLLSLVFLKIVILIGWYLLALILVTLSTFSYTHWQFGDFLKLLLLFWGYTVTFTKILTIYSWIHLLHHLIPLPPIPAIVSTGFIFQFSCLCTQYLHHIHPLHLFLIFFLSPPTGTNPQRGPVLGMSVFEKSLFRFVAHF